MDFGGQAPFTLEAMHLFGDLSELHNPGVLT